VTIRSAAAELYALPWELLTLRADGQHLGALDHVLLRYAWPGTATVVAETGEGPARLLVAWSAAGGGIPAAEHVEAIRKAAKAAGRDDAVVVLPSASYVAIAEALDAAVSSGRPFRALHLLCHGAEVGSTFGLALDAEGGEGRPSVVDAGRLQQLLAPYAHALRLVVVAACDGGNMGEPGNRIGSVAQRLHRAGVQYVIASRYPLSARGSTRIAGALHQALLDGDPVERAFVEARAAASREVSQLDWASLQLYARPEDGDRGCVLAPTAAAPEDAPASPGEAAKVATPGTVVPAAEQSSHAGRMRWALPIALGLVTIVGLGTVRTLLSEEEPEERPVTIASEAKLASEPEPVRVPAIERPDPDTAFDLDTGTGGDAAPSTTAEPTAGDPGSSSTTVEPSTATHDGTASTSWHPRRRANVDRTSAPKPIVRCSRGLREQIDDRLGSPGGGRYDVKVWAVESGEVLLQGCEGCGSELTDRVNVRLAKAKLRPSTEEDQLPCKVTIDWQ
jgi:hypothetical protein